MDSIFFYFFMNFYLSDWSILHPSPSCYNERWKKCPIISRKNYYRNWKQRLL